MSTVSVALTTYNGEKYIYKQLQSLLLQRRPIDEVIIIDDASEDKTVEIINDFIKKNQLSNWKLYENSCNIGFIKNFKKAIEKTTGDIIFLCDQDDIWCKTKVDSNLNRFESDDRVKAIYSGFKIINENDLSIKIHKNFMHSNNNLIKFRVEPFSTTKINFSTICNYNISPGCTLAFTREVRDIYIENTKNICVHDWEIAIIAAALDGLYFFNTPLTKYRIHDNNTIGLSFFYKNIKKNSLSLYDSRFNNAKKIYSYLKSLNIYKYLLDKNKSKTLNNSINFAKNRLIALENKSLFKVLGLYKYKNNYLNSVTLKGRFADMFCVLKKQKRS